MFLQIILLPVVLLQSVNVSASSFSERLTSFVSEAEVSEQCSTDFSLFTNSLRTFGDTVQLCIKNNGCTENQTKVLDENMFAVKEIDAFGKIPAGLLEITVVSSGSYTECKGLVAPYEVHYCYAQAAFNNQTNSIFEMPDMRIAVCMPKSCSEKDIPKVLNSVDIRGMIPLNFSSATCVPTNVQPTTAFWIFMSFMAIFVVWALVATVVDYVFDVYYKRKPGGGIVMRVLLSYSVYTNAGAILDTSPHKEGTLKSLASIRFISMTWVVAGHALSTNAMSDAFLPVLSMWNPLLSTTIVNAFFSVDTFFLLSGILVSYLFFKSKPSMGTVKNPFTWIMFYVHRYLRLTPAVMIFIGFYAVILPFTKGPWAASSSSPVDIDNVEVCKKYWWRNLLYINNLFPLTEECYVITWYLAVDTQLYLVAPIFLIILSIRPIIGLASLALVSAASVAYVYVITFRDDLPAVLMGVFGIPKMQLVFDEFYQKPWTRCTTYLIGIGVGYFLTIVKKPKIHWTVISSAWALAAAVALASLYGAHGYIKGADNWSQFVRATYNNFSRIGWALAVSWVIVANHLGWGGPIAMFMDHPLWKPLGRLSYCGYIVHFYIVTYVFNLDDRPTHYVSIWESYVYRAIPVIALSYLFGFIWSCLFEIPIVKMEKMLMETISPTKRDTRPSIAQNHQSHERIYAYDRAEMQKDHDKP